MAKELQTLELQSIEDGRAPENRIKDAASAQQMVSLLIKANELRVSTETKVKGMLDGNPPYAPTALRRTGQAYRCNVNFREAEAIHSAAVTPYYDLFAEAPYYCDIGLDLGEVSKSVAASKTVVKHFDAMLREYDGFDYNMQLAIDNMIDFGRGFVFWEDPSSWWFRAVQQSRVLVPDGTPCDLDQLEMVVVRQSWRVHEIWKRIKNRESASAAGWNVKAAMRAIADAVPEGEGQTTTTDDIERSQRQIRNNDLYETVRSSTINASHIFVKEFDQTVSHYIVPEVTPRQDSEKERGTPVEYLYTKRGKYETFRQVLGALFFDIGDGTWHSTKGLLIKMYPFIEIKNRLSCSVVDNAFLNLSVLVQPRTDMAYADSVLQQIGPVTVLRHGLEIQQWGLAGRMEEGLAVERSLENRLSANIGQYRTTVQKMDGNPETATKVIADQSKESMLTKGAVNRTYAQLDFIYEEIYRRVMESNGGGGEEGPGGMVRKFKKRCEDDGVDSAMLKKVKFVRAFRNIGNGSPFMRQQAIMQTSTLVPMLNDQGRENWLDDAISVSTNHDMVDRYNPKTGPNKMGDDHVTAALQVAAMKDMVLPRMTDTQDHLIFAQVYLEEAANELQLLKAGKDPIEVIKFLDIVGPEAAKRLQKVHPSDPRKGLLKALTQQWQEIAKVTDQIKQQMAQAADQQVQNAKTGVGAMNDAEMQALVAAKEEQRKDQQAKADIRRKDMTAKADIATKTAKANADIEIQREKATEPLTETE